MKICVAVSGFSPTGVPLAQLRFARALARKGHDIDFLVGGLDMRYPKTQYPVVPGVNVITLDQAKVRNMFFPLCTYLRKTKPDIVFSAEDHFNGVFLLAVIATRSKARISCSSRVPPSDSYSKTLFSKRWFKMQLMRAVMWRADALTCVSKDMVDDYRHYFGRSAPHVGVYNIIADKASQIQMREPLDDPMFDDRSSPLLVAAGTLTTRKGFADLIRAMKELSSKRKARLVILGEGPLRAELQSLIDVLGLSESVHLYGLVDNPLKYYVRSDIFVLSSYAEGLPNVLVEAMMCGCTPVATDCRTGPRELFDGGKYGYLAPVGDPVALAGEIAKALDKPIPAELLAQAIEPFYEEAIIQRHFEVLGLSMQKPLSIVFVIKALGNEGGGAERVFVNVASGMSERGHDVTVISSDLQGKAPYYHFDEAIRRINLGIGNTSGKSSISDLFRRTISFRKAIKNIKPDVVVAFMNSSFVPVGISILGTGVPMIASEHASREHYQTRFLERFILQITPLFSAKIAVVSQQMYDSYNTWLRKYMVVVANPVSFAEKKHISKSGLDSRSRKILLSVGRLSTEKNHRCLIEAFALIAPDLPDWTLRIVGEGVLRAELQAQVGRLGVSDVVELPGAVSDISNEYTDADLFVMPSIYESFGLATAEALLHGLPSVGYADCPGTNCLIENDVNGLLVTGDDRVQAMAITLKYLMSSPAELTRLSNAPTDSLKTQFGIDAVLGVWERLINEVAVKRN